MFITQSNVRQPHESGVGRLCDDIQSGRGSIFELAAGVGRWKVRKLLQNFHYIKYIDEFYVSFRNRILVCGDETQKPFPLLVWHLTQRKLLYDLRIPHHDVSYSS